MENYGYWQAINSRFLVLRFEIYASHDVLTVYSW